MDGKKLHDLTVDNFGKLGIKDPTTIDYHADFMQTEDDTNKMAGLICGLTKSEINDEQSKQIDEVLKENNINFDLSEIMSIGVEIQNFNNAAKFDPKRINLQIMIEEIVKDVDSGIQLIIDVSKNILVELTWNNVVQMVTFASWVFKHICKINEGKAAQVVLQIIRHFVKYIYCYIRDIVICSPMGVIIRNLLFHRWTPTLIYQMSLTGVLCCSVYAAYRLLNPMEWFFRFL